MLPLARIGDMCGGRILTGAVSVVINGRPAAMIGSHIEPHPYGDHVHVADIVTGASSVYVEGLPVAQLGSIASCAVHKVVTASHSVYGS